MVADRLKAEDVIRLLDLQPLAGEGGFFKRAYRSAIDYSDKKKLCSLIYYLILPESFSALHRLSSDEIWHFYHGSPAEQVRIHPDGSLERVVLGPDIAGGQYVSTVVPAGVWQGTRLLAGGEYALCGCSVVPEYEQSDYEHGELDVLSTEYPDHAEVLREFCVQAERSL